MYLFLVDLRTLGESHYKYFERLLPEIKAHRLLGEIKIVENNAAAVQIMLDNARRDRFKTVVAVGDDRFMACLAGAAMGTSTALGYIPFGTLSEFGTAMGLTSRVGEVGPVLAGRNLKTRALMSLGRYYAVHRVNLLPQPTWELLENRKFGLSGRAKRLLRFWEGMKSPPKLSARVEWEDACLDQEVVALSVALVTQRQTASLMPKIMTAGEGGMRLRLFSARLTSSQLSACWKVHDFGLPGEDGSISQLNANYVRITVEGGYGVWVDGHQVPADPPLDIKMVAGAFRLITPAERL